VSATAGVTAPTSIVFGTDGWRARIADEFTFENVRRCADGVAAYVEGEGSNARGVVIAYDRRFASEHFAAAAAEVLLAQGIPVGDLPDGHMLAGHVGDDTVLLARRGNEIFAIGATCTGLAHCWT